MQADGALLAISCVRAVAGGGCTAYPPVAGAKGSRSPATARACSSRAPPRTASPTLDLTGGDARAQERHGRVRRGGPFRELPGREGRSTRRPGFAVSPDGRHVYAATEGSDAVVTLRRDLLPACSAVLHSVPHNQPAAVPVSGSDPNGDAFAVLFWGTSPLTSGTISVTHQATDTITYTPNAGYAGPDVVQLLRAGQWRELGRRHDHADGAARGRAGVRERVADGRAGRHDDARGGVRGERVTRSPSRR